MMFRPHCSVLMGAVLSWVWVAVLLLLTCSNDWGKHDDFPLALDMFLSYLPHPEAVCRSLGLFTCLSFPPQGIFRNTIMTAQQSCSWDCTAESRAT
jgi:hypothetical protein